MSKWEMVRLGDVCEVVSGSTPKTNKPEYWNGTIKWVTPAELSSDSYIVYDTERHITEKAGLKPMPIGTVLLSSRAPIGKVAIAGSEMCCNQGFKNLICSEKIDSRYLYRYLKGKGEYLNSLGRGATFKEISKSIVENVTIPLPPLPIQQKIATILDQATTLIEKRKIQLQKLDQLIKSRFIEMFSDPVREDILPKFGTQPLIELCAAFVGGGTPAMSHPEYYEDGDIPWVKSGDIKSLNVERGVLSITKAGLENSTASMLPTGAVIVVTRSGILKHTLPVAITMNPLAINQDLKGIVANERVIPEYLLWAIKMNESRLLSQVRAVTADNIETEFLKKTPIAVPPIDIQHRFVNFVKQTGKSKSDMQQGLEKLEANYKALMQDNFVWML
jgi:type I restriction enzyme S subunit